MGEADPHAAAKLRARGLRVLAVALLGAGCLAVSSAQPAPARSAAPGGTPARTTSLPIATTVLQLTDDSRLAHPSHRRAIARRLVTIVRYPDTPSRGPYPLIVFAHGFGVTPATYYRLLRAWAEAGFVVAAPVFPLENARAPGGPEGGDVINEPSDISFVISKLLAAAAARSGPLSGRLDPARIAVAGQSDGGEAALAAAYSKRYRDPRIRAAVILSGAEMSGIGGYEFAAEGPALLAVQGTADTSNEPRYTYAYFRAAERPKYLLRLPGAQHLPPYTYKQPQLGVVEQLTEAFLESYLAPDPAQLAELPRLGTVAGVAELVSDP